VAAVLFSQNHARSTSCGADGRRVIEVITHATGRDILALLWA